MDRVPDVPEWLAIDIDHTYFLLQLLLRDIVTAKRDLRLSYFDG
jgi:hypothetical protein